MAEVDLLVIGAGPAGLAAAVEARGTGLSVLVLDEQGAPGGQIWRGVEGAPPGRAAVIGAETMEGADEIAAFRRCGVRHEAGAVVWDVGRDRQVHYTVAGASRTVKARHVIVATGALERPVPMPGWTLPGVMTAGALQILLKSSGVVPDGRVVLAGSGPLLWLLASQMVAAGAPPAAVVETVPRWRALALARDLVRAAAAARSLARGLSMMRTVRRAGVAIHRGARDLAVEGETQARGLRFTEGGRRRSIAAETVALHEGVVPNQQITRAIGARHVWDASQQAFRPWRDDWLGLDVDGFSVAGDGGGIDGAKAAALEGRLAALGAAHRLGRVAKAERDEAARPLDRALARERALRPFLEKLYAPRPETLRPADDVLVCRCEEVTAGAIREAVRLGASGPNQVKSFVRCGMGPCQGRLCGPTVSAVVAAERGVSEEAVGYFRIRPPLKPISLAELAALADEDGETPRAA